MSLSSRSDVLKRVNDAISGSNVRELISMLRSGQVDLDQRDASHDLTTVVMKTCHMNVETEAYQSIIKTLEDLNFDTDVTDAQGRTALMHACVGGKLRMFYFLLSLKSGTQRVDNDGNSTLVYAIKSGNVNFVEMVLEEDAAVELVQKKNNMGLLPVDIARQGGNPQIIKTVEVLTPQKPHRRKRSKRRNVVLPPAIHPTTFAHLATRDPSGRQGQPEASSRMLSQRDRGDGEMKPDDGFKDISWTKHSSQSVSAVPVESRLARCDGNPSECGLSMPGKNVTPRRRDAMDRPGNDENCIFPDVKVTARSEKAKDSFKCRRDSISLPDLRDMRRNLISGDVTPASADGPRSHVIGERHGDAMSKSLEAGTEKQNSILTELPNLRDKLKFTKCHDVRQLGHSKRKYNNTDAQHRSLIS